MTSMFIAPQVITSISRQALIGARHDDPVLPTRRRVLRRRGTVPTV
jgi:hypothetical protein